MLTAFVRAFQTPDLRKKMLITLALIALFRFGASLPTPGIDEKNVAFCSNAATTSSAAGVLQIERSTLDRKIKLYGLKRGT